MPDHTASQAQVMFLPGRHPHTANIVYAIAPDQLYETVPTTSPYYEGYTCKNAHLADAIVAKMTAIPTITAVLP